MKIWLFLLSWDWIFFKEAKVTIDFHSSRVYLPDFKTSHPICLNEPQFYAAQVSVELISDEEDLKLIDQAVKRSHPSPKVKAQLKSLMGEWPSVCTQAGSYKLY